MTDLYLCCNGVHLSVICFSRCDALDEYVETVRPSYRSASRELTFPGMKITGDKAEPPTAPIHHLSFYGSHLQINTACLCVWVWVWVCIYMLYMWCTAAQSDSEWRSTSGESINSRKRCVDKWVIMLLDLSAVKLSTVKILTIKIWSLMAPVRSRVTPV